MLLNQIGAIIHELNADYEKDVMLFETGFAYSNDFSDNYNNFISNNGNVLPYAETPEGQKDFLLDLAQIVDENNGRGIIYWEPAWVSSEMCDQWGQGSAYENVTLFDTDNQALPAFDFFEFCGTSNSDEEFLNSINIYPNPLISSKLTIQNVTQKASWELYNLKEDPGETNNLAAQYPEKVERLKKMLQAEDAKFPKPKQPKKGGKKNKKPKKK